MRLSNKRWILNLRLDRHGRAGAPAQRRANSSAEGPCKHEESLLPNEKH